MRSNKNKTVYVALSVDYLHEGHLKILQEASKKGKVIAGILTDNAIDYKKFPHLTFDERKQLIIDNKYVDKVIAQEKLDYTKNLILLKPDYVVHGDDWKTGRQKKIRQKVIKTLKAWDGELIEYKYSKNIKNSSYENKILKLANTPDNRRKKLSRLMKARKIVRIIEAHSALSGMITENLTIETKNEFSEFDGFWSSSLTDSTVRGRPDNQALDISSRTSGLQEILESTSKPMIFDGDNGGRNEHLIFTIKTLERLGVSGIALEDKVGLKKNSLFKDQSGVKQDSISSFCKKIKTVTQARVTQDFLIIARVESLILGKSINDALKRANAYSKAGADAIIIHSKEKNPNEIFKFAKIFSKSKYFKPLVAIPSTYSKTYEKTLIKNNFKIVIYANQMLRASYKAMAAVAIKILSSKRAFDAEKDISSVSDIIKLIK